MYKRYEVKMFFIEIRVQTDKRHFRLLKTTDTPPYKTVVFTIQQV